MKYLSIVLNLGEGGLGVTRALGRMGVDVYGVDHVPDAVGFGSKFCKKGFVFANPAVQPDQCLEQFIALGRSLDEKAVLLPTADAYVTFLSRFEPQLKEHFLFNIPSASVLEALVDKRRQYRVAEQCGITVPKTFAPENLEALEAIQDALPYPVFVKGVNSVQWNAEFHNKGFVADGRDDLRRFFSRAAGRGIPVLIQEIVVGPNRNHYKVCGYYSRNKELLALFCTQKARQYPTDFGVGSYMCSVHHPALMEMGRKFFEGIGYTGVGSIEFKKDDKDNQYKLMELNPRLWQQNIQATCAGINFPYINYLDCIGEGGAHSFEFRDDVRYLDVVADLLSFIGNWRRGDVSFLSWLESLRHVDCFAYVSRDDWGPLWNYGKQVIKVARRTTAARLRAAMDKRTDPAVSR